MAHHAAKRGLRTTAAVVGAVSLGLLSTLAFSTLAFGAAPLPDGTTPGELVITKTETPATTLAHNGTQQTVTNTPIQGVQFTIEQVTSYDSGSGAVNIDLTTTAGWDAAAALQAAMAGNTSSLPAAATTGTPVVLTTDANGVADFTNLPQGLYYVTETGAPAGVVPSDPFLVTIPMTDPNTTNAWMYTVYAYPKNDIPTLKKSMTPANGPTTVGQPFTFTLQASLPNDPDPNSTATPPALLDATAFQISDYLNPAYDVTTSGIVVQLVDPNGVLQAITLTSTTDYAVNYQPGVTPPAAVSPITYPGATGCVTPTTVNQLDVTLSASALAQTGGWSAKGYQVVVTVPAKVNTDGGVMCNNFYLYPTIESLTNPDQFPPSGPSNPTKVSFGGVTVFKRGVNSAEWNANQATVANDAVWSSPSDTRFTAPDNTTFYAANPQMNDDVLPPAGSTYGPFDGAQFQVYPAVDANGVAYGATGYIGTPVALQVPGSTTTIDTFTTGPDGINTDPSVAAGTMNVHGAAIICGLAYGNYMMVETKAPAGYELQAQPMLIQVTQPLDDTPGTADDYVVWDVQANAGFHMPLTGSTGIALSLLIGIAAVVGAGVVVTVQRRRARAAA